VYQTTPKSQMKNAANGRVSKNKFSRVSGIPNPPQWSSTLRTDFTQRFVVQSGGVNQLAINNIELQDLKCMATGATAAYRIFGAMKLNWVKAWCANSSATASNTIVIEMITTNPYSGSIAKTFTDTAVGTTNVAYVKAVPPGNSYTGEWLPNVGANPYEVFNITAPAGTVVDVNLSVELIDDESAIAVTYSVSGATAGYLYTRNLDSAAGTPRIEPIGVNYI
jgi:hypothetical protein